MLRFAFLLVLGAVALQEASSQKIGRRAGKAEALIEQRFDRKQLERELEDLDLEPVTRRPRLLRPLRPHNFVAASSESGTAQRLDPAAAVSPAGEGQKGFLGYPIETWILIAFCVGVFVLMCIIGMYFFRKHMMAIIGCMENTCFRTFQYVFIMPFKYMCTGCRGVAYPVKEGVLTCYTSVNQYFNPYKVIT